MSESKDAIVIGGSVGGLTAATYLARAGRRVLLLEAEEMLGGACRASSSLSGVRSGFGGSALYALDPGLVGDLGLRGLKFAVRDMPLIALGENGRHIALGRNMHGASRAIATKSQHDAQTYRRLHGEIFALARAMRPFWWEVAEAPSFSNASLWQLLTRMTAASALSYLGTFETDALRAALAFDVGHPLEAGSALALVWRAAQEMCGLQGAVATPLGGLVALADALVVAAQSAGVEIRTSARVSNLLLDGNAITGAALDTGEQIFGQSVVSSLSRSTTLLDLAPTASAGLAGTQKLMRSAPRSGEASILFLLNAAPDFGGMNISQTARFLVADRTESYVFAAAAIREGQLPDDLLLEVTVPTAADPSLAPPGQHLVSVRVAGLPLSPKESWPALTGKLIERVVAALERHATHLRARIVGTDTRMPVAEETESVARLTAPYSARIGTPIEGLFLCGTSAEPMNAISGRAGRLAAGIAQKYLAREKRP